MIELIILNFSFHICKVEIILTPHSVLRNRYEKINGTLIVIGKGLTLLLILLKAKPPNIII